MTVSPTTQPTITLDELTTMRVELATHLAEHRAVMALPDSPYRRRVEAWAAAWFPTLRRILADAEAEYAARVKS